MKRILALAAFLAFCVMPLTAQAVGYDEFARQLDQSLRLKDEKGLDKLIRDNSTHTVGHFRALVLGALADPKGGEGNQAQRDAIKASWQRVFEGRTLESVERWLQLLDPAKIRSDDRLKQTLNQGYTELARLREGHVNDRKLWESLADNLKKIADNFEQLGDTIGAADAHGLMATLFSSIPEKSIDDRERMIVALAHFADLRRSCDWVKDSYYLQNENIRKAEEEQLKDERQKAEKRSKEGYTGAVRGADAFLMPDADKAEKIVPLTFEVATKPKDDLASVAGPVPPKWLGVTINNTGPAKIDWFKGAELFLVRPAANKFGITLNGSEFDLKKNPFLEIEANSKPKKPSSFFLDADKKRPYAMWFFVGGSAEPFQGLSHNLEPYEGSDGMKHATVYYKSAASWTTEVDGVPITFYDENGNGQLFESDPFEYGMKDRNLGKGPDDEVPVEVLDSMEIGKGGIQPWSNWLKVGETWYHARPQDGGQKVGFRPTNPEYFKTGTLQFVWTGPKPIKPVVLVVQGSGDFANARFEVADGKPVELPASEYTVVYGRIEQKAGGKLVTAEIFGGKFAPLKVEAGATAKLEIGAPFHIGFEKDVKDGKLSVDAVKLRLYGKSGEIYAKLNGCVLTPTVVVSKSADGKGGRDAGEFVAIPDPETLNKLASKFSGTLSNNVGYYPMPKGANDTTVLTVPFPDGSFAGLADRKNKFFGKIDPVFQ
ncbi:MAG: hypothetical protein U1F36_07950 [Planctomycetota bacterium]